MSVLKYSKNLILCGEVDFFCLLCKESFKVVDEVEKHIRWEQHRKLIKNQEYLPKFRKDCVYKVQDNYFCEICNYVIASVDAVKDHLKEDGHKAKKSNKEVTKPESLIKREFVFVVVSKFVLNKKEWHGIVNGKCLFCNVPVPNYNEHIALPGHMISLIQAEIIYEKDGRVYRKINEDKYFCFKCKKPFIKEDITTHWTSDEHNGTAIIEYGETRHLYKIDRENSYAICTLCNASIPWSFLSMDRHRQEHIKKKEWTKNEKESEHEFMTILFKDKGQLRSNLKKFGQENFIKMNEGGSKGYCTICNVHISANIINFRQHVIGLRHTSFLEYKGHVKKTKKSEKAHYKTKPFEEYFKEVVHIKRLSTFLFTNLEICINILSFALLTPVTISKNQKILCYMCDGLFPDIGSHLDEAHRKKLLKIPVVYTLKDEFVREVHPGLYHCGICNEAFAGWSVLEKHLNLIKHRYARVEASRRVDDFLESNAVEFERNYLDPENFVLD